jgi:hypothetical protein
MIACISLWISFLSQALTRSDMDKIKSGRKGTMIESPDIGWETFAKMADNELNLGEAVEDSVSAETESMNTDSGGEDMWSPAWTTLPKLLLDGGRSKTRMHVNWNIEVLNCFPEDIVVLRVVVNHGVSVRST